MLDLVAGAFYLNTEVDISIRELLDNQNFDGEIQPHTEAEVLAFGGEVGFISDSKPKRVSHSIYGQGTINVTDSMRTIFGLRYTNDDVKSQVSNFYGREALSLDISGEKLTGRAAL